MRPRKYFSFILLLLVPNIRFSFGFRGAVFEHAQQSYTTSGDPAEIINKNLKYYEVAADLARSKGVDVIVFPEYGIFPDGSRKRMKSFLEFIPDPNVTRCNPCEEPQVYSDRPILYNLSCMARKNKLIVVANMGDIQPCKGEKECPKDGVFQYNTNVALDRDGTLLAKYHKEHLFVEPGMDIPVVVQDPTFRTDVGRFAMFVCFDIVFKRITEVAHWKGVQAVLLPTMWINNAPMFNSFQYFESWAIGNNVTLLAADVHLPGGSTIGSGIYAGRKGAIVYTFNPDGQSKLLISDLQWTDIYSKPNSSIYIVTLNGTKEWTDDGADVGEECSQKVLKPVKNIYKEYRCLERNTQNFTLQKLVKNYGHIELCNNGMCCSLDYSADRMKEDFYLGVFNGTFNAVNRYFFEEENCFLARCDSFKNQSCVIFPMRSKTRFYNVYMKANFSTSFIYPTVMSSGMRLLPKQRWMYETNGKTASIHSNGFAGNDLLTVGFKARAYDRDPPYVNDICSRNFTNTIERIIEENFCFLNIIIDIYCSFYHFNYNYLL